MATCPGPSNSCYSIGSDPEVHKKWMHEWMKNYRQETTEGQKHNKHTGGKTGKVCGKQKIRILEISELIKKSKQETQKPRSMTGLCFEMFTDLEKLLQFI